MFFGFKPIHHFLLSRYGAVGRARFHNQELVNGVLYSGLCFQFLVQNLKSNSTGHFYKVIRTVNGYIEVCSNYNTEIALMSQVKKAKKQIIRTILNPKCGFASCYILPQRKLQTLSKFPGVCLLTFSCCRKTLHQVPGYNRKINALSKSYYFFSTSSFLLVPV